MLFLKKYTSLQYTMENYRPQPFTKFANLYTIKTCPQHRCLDYQVNIVYAYDKL